MKAIKQVIYKRGMLDQVRDARRLPSQRFTAPNVPTEILAAIERESLVELDGVFGDPTLGEPVQYDEVQVEHAGGTAVIRLFNRAIMLLHPDSERVRRIHRVCCTIQSACQPPEVAS